MRTFTAIAVLWALAGCTKVNEQPAPPPVMETPRALTKKPALKVASRVRWPSDQILARRDPVASDAGRVDTLNGDPNGLRREDLQRVIDGVLPTVANCFQATGGTSVSVSFDAEPAGRAANVKASGGGADGERCVTDALAGLGLPSFSGPSVPVQFPVTIQRTVEAPPPSPPPPPPRPAPEPAPAPSVFMNP